jgi:hypothetical protein
MSTNLFFRCSLGLPIVLPLVVLVILRGPAVLSPLHPIWQGPFVWPVGFFPQSIVAGGPFYAVVAAPAWWMIGKLSPPRVVKLIATLPWIHTSIFGLFVIIVTLPDGSFRIFEFIPTMLFVLAVGYCYVLLAYTGYIVLRKARMIRNSQP